ncbi:MAG: hypothetical protein KF784_15320 [Fimbriimonadaceae bacterium]|nr:hypothetical protein [Fimbriimonadaceae bacterium]
MRHARTFLLLLALIPTLALAQQKVTDPKIFFGHEIGADYQLPNYQALSKYWALLDKESDRMTVKVMGKTEEGRDQLMAIVSSPDNIKKLEHYRKISEKLARAENLSDAEAKKLAAEGKAVVWIDGGLHASEVLCAQVLMESVYQLISHNDEETKRILNDVIILFVHANPDGMDLMSDWYMQESDPNKRGFNIPRLYQKYIGHDNNRDFYAATQRETKNMNRVMYREWYPQIMYNHHQTGPRGTVMFAPPFRDPFNHNIDPQVMAGIEQVGIAMHTRFIRENKPGVTMRDGASYSTWWNGGLRTTAYFHNIVGILTETIGSPTPMRIPFVANRLEPKGNLIFPIGPQEWKFRQSVDYSVTANYAILDIASRYRSEWLYGMYQMGRRQIENGSKDSWIDYPSRLNGVRNLEDVRKPELRSPRGYIIPRDQDDFFTAEKFVTALVENGIDIHRATAEFEVGGRKYPAGSLIVKSAQAFRAHILDMFEPQDHPNDITAPGAPPTPPYDNAGYTLAYQMGVKFDRILDAFEGPFEKIVDWKESDFSSDATQLSDRSNYSYKAVFEWFKAGKKVYRNANGFASTSNGNGDVEIKLPRIALWDRYGGSMDSGWIRWIFDQWGIPYTVVFARELDTGLLKEKYDVIIFVDGAIPATLRDPSEPNYEGIPASYWHMLGSVSKATVLQLKNFLEAGGTVVTIGGSTSLGKHLELPIESHLMEDGKPLGREKYYVPGSVLSVAVDNTLPVSRGMGERANVMFDNSPVFKITGDGVKPIAWFDSPNPLRSGWAWGAKYLDKGVAMAQAPVGKGTLYLFGPEITFRAQSHGTFKLLFNAMLK